MTKTFVLDTNVLLHNADSIESFADNTVVIPMAVIEELDKFKTLSNELGRNARQAIRRLDTLRNKGNLRDGVPLSKTGSLKIISSYALGEDIPLDNNITDNRILRVAFALHKSGELVIFVSKDINARIKADAIGLKAVDFEKQKVNLDELYSGYSDTKVPSDTVTELIENKMVRVEGVGRCPNEFVTLIDESNLHHTAIGRVVEKDTVALLPSRHERIWSIRSRNREQRMALELLMDKSVQIVTLVGRAGTGKTLMALAAALHSTLNNKDYDRILVSRPIIPMGKDIGYLPGDKNEKLSHWMQPIFDNLTYLLREEHESINGKKKKGKNSAQTRVEHLMQENIIVLEALTYIRGRTIPGQFVIVDEAQNLTPHEVKTIISRAGEGTKMVLTGDPYQIDNPYLDASSNGLTYAAERLKQHSIHGHVSLVNSERSLLAAIAAEYL